MDTIESEITSDGPYEDSYGVIYDNGDVSLERVPYQYSSSPQDTVHTVMDGETLWNIALQEYGDSRLYYLIGDANDIVDPLGLTIGQQLVIPPMNQNYG